MPIFRVQPAIRQSFHVSNVETVGEGELCSCYKGSYNRLNVKDKELNKLAKSCWEKAKSLLPTGAHDLEINFSQISVTYIDRDGKIHRMGELAGNEDVAIDSELQELMKKVRRASKQLWRKVTHSAEFGNQSNRPLDGKAPFEMSQASNWINYEPHSLGEFFDKEHFGKLQAALPQNQQKAAMDRIMATESFHRKLLSEVAMLRARKEQETEAPGFEEGDPAAKKRVYKSLEDLREFERRLRETKRHPLLWAVGIWGDADPTTISGEERIQKSKAIQNGIHRTMMGDLKDKRGQFKKAWDWAIAHLPKVNNETTELERLGPFIPAYAQDAGDLVFNNRLELSDLANKEKRNMKAVSIEEFLVHNMIHMDHSLDEAKALDGLGLQLDAKTKADLVKALSLAKTEAKTVREKVEKIPGPWESRLVAVKNDASLKVLLGKK